MLITVIKIGMILVHQSLNSSWSLDTDNLLTCPTDPLQDPLRDTASDVAVLFFFFFFSRTHWDQRVGARPPPAHSRPSMRGLRPCDTGANGAAYAPAADWRDAAIQLLFITTNLGSLVRPELVRRRDLSLHSALCGHIIYLQDKQVWKAPDWE